MNFAWRIRALSLIQGRNDEIGEQWERGEGAERRGTVVEMCDQHFLNENVRTNTNDFETLTETKKQKCSDLN